MLIKMQFLNNLNKAINDALGISGCSDYNRVKSPILPDIACDIVAVKNKSGKSNAAKKTYAVKSELKGKENEPEQKKWTFIKCFHIMILSNRMYPITSFSNFQIHACSRGGVRAHDLRVMNAML